MGKVPISVSKKVYSGPTQTKIPSYTFENQSKILCHPCCVRQRQKITGWNPLNKKKSCNYKYKIYIEKQLVN